METPAMTHTIDSQVDPRIFAALPKCTKSQLTALLEIRRRGTVGLRTLGVSNTRKPTVAALVAHGLVTEETGTWAPTYVITSMGLMVLVANGAAWDYLDEPGKRWERLREVLEEGCRIIAQRCPETRRRGESSLGTAVSGGDFDHPWRTVNALHSLADSESSNWFGCNPQSHLRRAIRFIAIAMDAAVYGRRPNAFWSKDRALDAARDEIALLRRESGDYGPDEHPPYGWAPEAASEAA